MWAALLAAGVAGAAADGPGIVRDAADSDRLNFLVMADWGGSPDDPYTTPAEISTAGGMAKVGQELFPPAKWTLAVGDNFYTSGVTSVESPRFKHTFEDVFSDPFLNDDFNFYVIAGNHDHGGNVSAQIAYSKVSTRSVLPLPLPKTVLNPQAQPLYFSVLR